jgi:hypothetical protein
MVEAEIDWMLFGTEQVHLNVEIIRSRAARVSDVDTRVAWGNGIIAGQTKSTWLTQELRKGHDQVILDNFKKAVQAAYGQGATCATCLLDDR